MGWEPEVTQQNTKADLVSVPGQLLRFDPAASPINYTIFVNNTGPRTIKNITINDSILGAVQSTPGFDLLPGQNKTYFKVASHNCSYCDGFICRICDYALACGDVYKDAVNKTHVCIISNEVCLSISQQIGVPVYPG